MARVRDVAARPAARDGVHFPSVARIAAQHPRSAYRPADVFEKGGRPSAIDLTQRHSATRRINQSRGTEVRL